MFQKFILHFLNYKYIENIFYRKNVLVEVEVLKIS